jgi:hypothetical protein
MRREEIEMSALTLKTRPVDRAMATPMVASSIMTRVTALAISAVVAGSVFSAGWAAADMFLKAL